MSKEKDFENVLKVGTLCQMKSRKELLKITGIGNKKDIVLDSGLTYKIGFLVYADSRFIITDVAFPSDGNNLKEPSYATSNIFFTKELFNVLDGTF